MKQAGWCLKTPRGRLIAETFGENEDDCWGKSFDFLCHTTTWMKNYWKKWEESIEAAADHNFRMVRVAFVELRPLSKGRIYPAMKEGRRR